MDATRRYVHSVPRWLVFKDAEMLNRSTVSFINFQCYWRFRLIIIEENRYQVSSSCWQCEMRVLHDVSDRSFTTSQPRSVLSSWASSWWQSSDPAKVTCPIRMEKLQLSAMCSRLTLFWIWWGKSRHTSITDKTNCEWLTTILLWFPNNQKSVPAKHHPGDDVPVPNPAVHARERLPLESKWYANVNLWSDNGSAQPIHHKPDEIDSVKQCEQNRLGLFDGSQEDRKQIKFSNLIGFSN